MFTVYLEFRHFTIDTWDYLSFKMDLHLFLVSNRVMVKPSEDVDKMQPLSLMGVSIQRSVSSLPAAIGRESGFSAVRVDFPCKNYVTQINGLFVRSGVCGMFEEDNYPAVKNVFIWWAKLDVPQGFGMMQLWSLFTTLIPKWCPKYCLAATANDGM